MTDAEAKFVKVANETMLRLVQKKNLKFKDSPHLVVDKQTDPDFFYPPTDQLSYDNHIIGFEQRKGSFSGINIIMSNGQRSKQPQTQYANQYTDVAYNPDYCTVSRVEMRGFPLSEFGGV